MAASKGAKGSGSDRHLKKIVGLDRRLGKAAKPIKVLKRLEWPESVGERFLADYRAGRPRLPKVALQPRSHSAEIEALEALMGRCDRSHPLGNFLFKTAWSYLTAAKMIEGIGT